MYMHCCTSAWHFTSSHNLTHWICHMCNSSIQIESCWLHFVNSNEDSRSSPAAGYVTVIAGFTVYMDVCASLYRGLILQVDHGMLISLDTPSW